VKRALVLGGGVSGLTSASELLSRGWHATVLEREDAIGGLATGFTLAGHPFDHGPHALYTQHEAAYRYFKGLLGDELRAIGTKHVAILFRGREFPYPLKLLPAARELPLREALAAGSDLLWAKLRNAVRRPRCDSFESYVESHFGRTLYRIFFRDYTRKVWGVPPATLSASFASERIPKVRIWRSLVASVVADKTERPGAGGDFDPRQFYYPKGGLEQLHLAHRRRIEGLGGRIFTGARAVSVRVDGGRATAVAVERNGAVEQLSCDALVSTIPINHLVSALGGGRRLEGPAAGLKHRSIVFVYLVVARPKVFEHQWVYYQDPGLVFHRVYENRHFVDASALPPGTTGLCAEVTDHEGLSDCRMLEQTVEGLERLGLLAPGEVVAHRVVRLAEAYPLYTTGYEAALRACLQEVRRVDNVWTVGRQGLFRYVDMDHCVLMGQGVAAQVASERRTLAEQEIVAAHSEA
jgi:protoporphyrinogen oxidase